MKRYHSYLADGILLIVYFATFCGLLSYYPMPQMTWDSFYYVEYGMRSSYGIRPFGYSWFLTAIYEISHSILAVVWAQFLVFYIAAIVFVRTITSIFRLPIFLRILLGIVVLLEPVTLYHINNILSDLLFTAFTLLSFSFLLLFLHRKHVVYALLHIVTIFICIEIRYIALFYPFFSCIVIFFSSLKAVAKWATILVILLAYAGVYKAHISVNEKKYGTPVFSAFSGWTHANNALYALPRIKLDAKYIEDEEIRSMHDFFTRYLDTSSFVVRQIGSGYLWDDRSPLNVIRLKLMDSAKVDYNTSWFWLAGKYHKYGTFIQRNFPYEYLTSYMVPNISTLLKPHHGEMGYYDIMPYYDETVLKYYGLAPEQMVCKKDVYKLTLNKIIEKAYRRGLLLFALASALYLLFLRRRLGPEHNAVLLSIIFFVTCFYLLTLYSSWFMYRYLMPVFPLMAATIILVVYSAVNRKAMASNEP